MWFWILKVSECVGIECVEIDPLEIDPLGIGLEEKDCKAGRVGMDSESLAPFSPFLVVF
jgi:hypothetical protein